MTIDELNALTTLTATDEVPVWDSEESGEPTKKITASNLAASVKSLASLPSTTEMNTAIAQSTANVVAVSKGGTGATSASDAISNLFNVGDNVPSAYPNKPGIYHIISNIFTNFTPASQYGVLIIFGASYTAHLYIDAYNNLYVGYAGSMVEPTTWHTIS